MTTYPELFKARMVQKLTAPGGPSATALSEEVGVAQPTLSKWVREAGKVGAMSPRRREPGAPKRLQDWTAEEKMQVVAEAALLADEEFGALLRRRGLHQSDLTRWRRQMLAAVGRQPKSTKNSPERRRIRELERELGRKEKALAEAAALLVLQRKARALWGAEDHDTTPRSGR